MRRSPIGRQLSIAHPTLFTPMILAVDLTPPDMLGSLLGAFNVVGGAGQVFFIQIGGILFDTMGPASPFLFIGLANLVVMAYAIAVMNSPTDRLTSEKIV